MTVGPRPEDPAPRRPTGAEGGTERRTYTYSLATRGSVTADTQFFAIHVAQTLNDPRGWSLGGSIEFRQVSSGGDFTVYLAEAWTVPSFGSPCSSMWSCRVGRAVIINQTRWQSASASWNAAGASLDSYRHYVVNHETGHWLGFGHASCPGPGQAAPVMQQQSKGLDGCRHNTWPVPGERSAAGSRHGVGVRGQGDAIQHSEFGRRATRSWPVTGTATVRRSPGLVRGNEWRLRNRLSSGGPAADVHLRRRRRPGRVWRLGRQRHRDGRRGPGNPMVAAQQQPRGVPGHQLPLRHRRGPAGRGGLERGRHRHAGMVDGNHWAIRNRNSTGTPANEFTFGRPNDRPVVGDWDGNGRTDPGMVRGRPWLLRRSLTSGLPDERIVFGNVGVPPVVGRWIGLANDLPGRTINGRWHYRRFAPEP